MEYLAELEIDGIKINNLTQIILKQQFNQHHQFTIILKNLTYGEKYKLDDYIGKSVVICYYQGGWKEVKKLAYEFHGTVTEINLDQTGVSDPALRLTGFSNSYKLEDGINYASFYQKKLDKIVKDSVNRACEIEINNAYQGQIDYISQYKESTFNFLNRLSKDYNEYFYYTGTKLVFGKPSVQVSIDEINNYDLSSLQLNLKLLPQTFSEYSYLSADDKLIKSKAPATIDGLGQYATKLQHESNLFFSKPVYKPIDQRVHDQKDLDELVKNQKKAIAASQVVLTGSSSNPTICIGCILNVIPPGGTNAIDKDENYESYLITKIEHHITDGGRYSNTFEGIPASTEVIPVHNVYMPIAEPQLAIVKENNDPKGRVKVQMFWQENNEITDWLRVMTPDAGSGKDGAKNRGFVAIPEKGDQVMIGFTYNDPDRPFVMGGMFHGKSGGGGGNNNNSKTIIHKSGSVINLIDICIFLIDAGGNSIKFDGAGNIHIECKTEFNVTVGETSKLIMTPDKISLIAPHIFIQGTTDVNMCSDASTQVWIAGTNIDMNGTNAKVHGTSNTEIIGGSKAKLTGGTIDIGGTAITVNGSGPVQVNGSIVAING